LEREAAHRPRGNKKTRETAVGNLNPQSRHSERAGRKRLDHRPVQQRSDAPAVISPSVRDTISRFQRQSKQSAQPDVPTGDIIMDVTAIDTLARPQADAPLHFTGHAANERASDATPQSRKDASDIRRVAERFQKHSDTFHSTAQDTVPEKSDIAETPPMPVEQDTDRNTTALDRDPNHTVKQLSHPFRPHQRRLNASKPARLRGKSALDPKNTEGYVSSDPAASPTVFADKKHPTLREENRTRARFAVPPTVSPDAASAIAAPETLEAPETRILLEHPAADAETQEDASRSFEMGNPSNQGIQQIQNTLKRRRTSDTGLARRRTVPAETRPGKLRFSHSEPTSAGSTPRSSIRMRNAAEQGGTGSAVTPADQTDTTAQPEILSVPKPLSSAPAARSGSTPSKNTAQNARSAPAAFIPAGSSDTPTPSETSSTSEMPNTSEAPDTSETPPTPTPAETTNPSAESKTPLSDSVISPAVPTRHDPDKDPNAGEARAEEISPPKPSKLRFDKNEAPPTDTPLGKKLTKARTKAERSAAKLTQAKKRLPKKRRLQIQKTADPETGKIRRKLHFETEIKSQRSHLKGALVTCPVKAAANASVAYGHKNLYQVEHENVGTQAAHRGELLAEGGLRSAYRLYKTAPYHKVEKLTRKTAKLNMKAAYQQTLHDHPLLKSNPLSRMVQKRKIKKQYAKTVREARKTAGNVKKAGSFLGKTAQSAVQAAARHPLLLAVAGGLGLLIALISGIFASCANLGAGAGSVMTATSYLAADTDIEAAELAYTEFETDLRLEITDAENNWPGYNEYHYHIGDVSHNPHELMALLTARFQGFVYSGIEEELRNLFAEQYQLTFTPSVEIRYADPSDDNDDGDFEPYDWNILTVSLTTRPLDDIAAEGLSDAQRQHYDTLTQTQGARQLLANPLNMDWLPYVTSVYGWRVHPVTGEKNLHRGVGYRHSHRHGNFGRAGGNRQYRL
jgi:hypothetical protein